MTDFNAFAPNYSDSADPVAGFHGPNSKGREGKGRGREGGKGREWGKKGRGCPVFSLSRPVNHKHNPCTCRMLLRCCPAMAREHILT